MTGYFLLIVFHPVPQTFFLTMLFKTEVIAYFAIYLSVTTNLGFKLSYFYPKIPVEVTVTVILSFSAV
jgi:hypothetical protein